MTVDPQTITDSTWLRPTIEKLNELLSLEEDWDSYGGKRIREDCVIAAIRLLMDCMGDSSIMPLIVPGPKGTIQLEWHLNDIELEIECLGKVRGMPLYDTLGEIGNQRIEGMLSLRQASDAILLLQKSLKDEK